MLITYLSHPNILPLGLYQLQETLPCSLLAMGGQEQLFTGTWMWTGDAAEGTMDGRGHCQRFLDTALLSEAPVTPIHHLGAERRTAELLVL